MNTIQEISTGILRNDILKDVRSLKCHIKELLQKIRSVRVREAEEYRQNIDEQTRLTGLLDALIDYLTEEDRLDKEDDHE